MKVIHRMDGVCGWPPLLLVGFCDVDPTRHLEADGEVRIEPPAGRPRFRLAESPLPMGLGLAARPVMRFRAVRVHRYGVVSAPLTPCGIQLVAEALVSEGPEWALEAELGGPSPEWLPGWRPAPGWAWLQPIRRATAAQ